MSRKKMLVAEGYFDGAGQPYGEEQKRIYIGEVERVVVEEDVVEEDVVEEDDEFFYCQFSFRPSFLCQRLFLSFGLACSFRFGSRFRKSRSL